MENRGEARGGGNDGRWKVGIFEDRKRERERWEIRKERDRSEASLWRLLWVVFWRADGVESSQLMLDLRSSLGFEGSVFAP